jgi:branched-chain amino acid transport system permease protein
VRTGHDEQAARAGSGLPPRLRRLASRNSPARGAVDGIALVILLCVPLVVSNGYDLHVVSLGWLYGTMALGVVISYGYVGIPNMSQATLYGIGAYVAGDLMIHLGWPFLAAALVGAAAAGVMGGFLGATALRVKGNYWWLITIAFTQIMFVVFNSWTSVTGGENGLLGIPAATIGSFQFLTNSSFYYLTLVILALVYMLYARFTTSRAGLAARATHADETAARGLGVSPGTIRVVVMILAGLGAGLAGAGIIAVTGFVDANSFSLDFSFQVMLFAIVGGITSLRGAVLASVLLTYLTTQITSLVNYQLLIFGGVVLAALLVRLYIGDRRRRSGPVGRASAMSAGRAPAPADSAIREGPVPAEGSAVTYEQVAEEPDGSEGSA